MGSVLVQGEVVGENPVAPGRGTRQWRIAFWGLLAALGLGTALATWSWSATVARASDYDHAQVCQDAACGPTAIEQSAATVLQTGTSGGYKSPTYWLTLRDASDSTQRIALAHNRDVWSVVQPGDTVAVLIWQGQITLVQYADASSQTANNPDYAAYIDTFFLLLVATPFLAAAVWIGMFRIAPLRGYRPLGACWIIVGSVVLAVGMKMAGRLEVILIPLSLLIATGVLLSAAAWASCRPGSRPWG